jgi:hypothetical protein
VSGFIATRQALDIDNGKTVITIVIGVCALLVVFGVLFALLAGVLGLGFLMGRAL